KDQKPSVQPVMKMGGNDKGMLAECPSLLSLQAHIALDSFGSLSAWVQPGSPERARSHQRVFRCSPRLFDAWFKFPFVRAEQFSPRKQHGTLGLFKFYSDRVGLPVRNYRYWRVVT